MNIRIFLVRAMKCMCAQTRPRFMLSFEGVLGGKEFEPMLTPREKSPLPENVPRGGSNPRRCGQRAQTLPTELFRPPHFSSNMYVIVHRSIYCSHETTLFPVFLWILQTHKGTDTRWWVIHSPCLAIKALSLSEAQVFIHQQEDYQSGGNSSHKLL